jgi:hypothetical protein
MNSLIVLPLFFAAALGSYLPLHAPAVAYRAAPVVAHTVAHVSPAVVGHAHSARTQYHSQDNYGTYDYGYAEPNGAKKETRHPDGTVTGTYSHPLPDGRVLTNNYVADEYGFRSDLAPTAPKDFAPVVKAAYDVAAPVVAHTVDTHVIPQAPLHIAKSVDYVAAPAVVKSYAAAAPAYGYGYAGYGYPAPAYGYGAYGYAARAFPHPY